VRDENIKKLGLIGKEMEENEKSINDLKAFI